MPIIFPCGSHLAQIWPTLKICHPKIALFWVLSQILSCGRLSTLAGIELMLMLKKEQMKWQAQRGKTPSELFYALAG